MLNDLLSLLLVIASGAVAVMAFIANHARQTAKRLQRELDEETAARERERAIAAARNGARRQSDARILELNRSLDTGRRNQMEGP